MRLSLSIQILLMSLLVLTLIVMLIKRVFVSILVASPSKIRVRFLWIVIGGF